MVDLLLAFRGFSTPISTVVELVYNLTNRTSTEMIVRFLSLALLIGFRFNSILPDSWKAMPAYYMVSFDWNAFIHSFTLRWCLSLKLRCVCRQEILFLDLFQLCLLIGESRPLIFKVINEMCMLVVVIILLIIAICIFSGISCFNNYIFILSSWYLCCAHFFHEYDIILPFH